MELTEHGENVANQVNGEDAYGCKGKMNAADVWNIVDQLHTHFLDQEDPNCEAMMRMLEKWMDEITMEYEVKIF